MPEHKKKNSFIQVRVTPERKAAIRAKAREAGLSVTDLIDQALDRTRVWSPENKQVARERLVQLARIGNNLNQLAAGATRINPALMPWLLLPISKQSKTR